MEPVELRVDDLLIRPFGPDDAPAVYAACQDPDIQRFTGVPSPYRPEHAEGFVGRLAPEGWANGTAATFGVFDVTSGMLLGSMGFPRLDLTARVGEIGYWMAPAARGRGVASRSGRAVARWGFDALGLRRVTWYADLGNHASRLVALRIGVTVEGIARAHIAQADGSYTDAWAGALLPGEVLDATPAHLAAGSPYARRALAFGAPPPRLAFGGGTLRAFEERDLDAILATSQDPETVRWTQVPSPYGPADAAGYLALARHGWATGTNAIFAIADENDDFAGSTNLRLSHDPRDPDTAEIGYGVSARMRGRGLAAEATRALCRWGFDALALDRVRWRAYVGNEASRRTAEKAGFVLEGIERGGCVQRGHRIDAWTGALLAGDAR